MFRHKFLLLSVEFNTLIVTTCTNSFNFQSFKMLSFIQFFCLRKQISRSTETFSLFFLLFKLLRDDCQSKGKKVTF